MYDRLLDSYQGIKSLLYYMFSRLGKHLDGHIVRDQVVINQFSQEMIFRFRSCRKSYFDFLESQFYQVLKELYFFFQTHRNDQRLVPVSQVYAAPGRSLFYVIFFDPFIMRGRRWEISHAVPVVILHFYTSFLYAAMS